MQIYNITSGSPVDEEASRCLLTIEERGRVLHSEFNKRLCSNQGPEKIAFWNPIKMVEWKDFSGNERKTKLKSSTGKTMEVAVQRDILAFLLAKSQELNLPVDVDEALKYSLSEVPLSIAHADGSNRKTNKSALYDAALSSTMSSTIDIPLEGQKAYILDLAALIRSTVNVPPFEELALKIYSDIPKGYIIIYVACDTYKSSD